MNSTVESTEVEGKVDILEASVIIYTDGSFLATDKTYNSGYSGGGVHGYLYTSEGKKSDEFIPDGYKTCSNGYLPSGVDGKIVEPCMYLDFTYAFGKVYNNVMAELEAARRGVDDVINQLGGSYPITDILICTDSNYVIYCLETIFTKQKEEWDTPKQKNRELISLLYNTYQMLSKMGIKLRYKKVEAHSGIIGNELADKLAYFGREQSVRGVESSWLYTTSAKGYWKSVERHPLLRYRQLFFTTENTGSPVYSVMEYSTTMEPGKKTHDACFGLVTLNEKQPIIDDAITSYRDYGINLGAYSVVSTLNLNTLYNNNTLRYYNMFGSSSFNYSPKLAELRSFSNAPIVYSIRPAGLAVQAIERMGVLSTILEEFNKGGSPTKVRTFVNITDQIYSITTTKAGKLSYNAIPELGVNQFKIRVNVDKPLNILLDLGKDTLSRNQFKALQKDEPEVWLVLDKEPSNVPNVSIYRYYTIVKTKTGDIGIFCNFYSGIQLVDETKS